MLVEVAGPSGAGKSVLTGKLIAALDARGLPPIGVCQQSAGSTQKVPQHICDSDAHNIRTDLYLIPWAVTFVVRNPRFVWFSLLKIINRRPAGVPKWSIIRALWRKCGICSYFKRSKFDDDIVVVDEGLFHTAQYYLVHPDEKTSPMDVERFTKLVPLPDRLLIVNTDAQTLFKRSMSREDFYPANYSEEQKHRFAENGQAVFAQMSIMNCLQSVVRQVVGISDNGVQEIVDEVVSHKRLQETTAK